MPWALASIFAIDGKRSCTVLMSRRPQRMSSTEITLSPRLAAGLSTSALDWVNSASVGVMSSDQAKSRSAVPRETWR